MQSGDRVLSEAEKSVILAATSIISDSLGMEAGEGKPQTKYDVEVFDQLTWQQRLGLLVVVLEALVDEKIPVPTLTAANEGTIAAIFTEIRDNVDLELEVDSPDERFAALEIDHYAWRRMILACFDDDTDLPELKSTDPDDWASLLDALTDRILWDADYDLDDLIVDSAPELAVIQKASLSIDPNYFTTVPTDPLDVEIDAYWSRLDAIVDKTK